MSAASWWDKSTGLALLTMLSLAAFAALTETVFDIWRQVRR